MAPAAGRHAGDEHELLVEQVLDGEPRRLARPVHDGEIERALEQALGHHRRQAGGGGDGDVGDVLAQPGYPPEQEAVPQRGMRADRQMVAIGAGEADLQLGVMPHPHQRQRMLLELLAGAGERRPALGALEQRPPEQLLQHADARAHRRLRDVHLARSVDEAAGLGNHQEGLRKGDVHPSRLPLADHAAYAGIYLSKTSIGVSGKKRLATRAKIFTLTGPGRDSGDSWKDCTMKAKKAKKTAKKKTAKKKKK